MGGWAGNKENKVKMYCICIFSSFHSVGYELWNHCWPGEPEQLREKWFGILPCLMQDAGSHSPGVLGSQDVWRNVLEAHKQERNVIVPELDSCHWVCCSLGTEEMPPPEKCTSRKYLGKRDWKVIRKRAGSKGRRASSTAWEPEKMNKLLCKLKFRAFWASDGQSSKTTKQLWNTLVL